jgi:hypothetical protein
MTSTLSQVGTRGLVGPGTCYDPREKVVAMALDGLWTVDFGAMGGGVIVLKNGEILGGDSSRVYVGMFTEEGTKLKGQLRINWYAGERNTLWGDQAEKIDTTLTGDASGNTITGKVTRTGYSERPFRMTKRA